MRYKACDLNDMPEALCGSRLALGLGEHATGSFTFEVFIFLSSIRMDMRCDISPVGRATYQRVFTSCKGGPEVQYTYQET